MTDSSVAQEIMNSLTLLVALRPRSVSSDAPSVVPPAPVLRALQSSLPSAPTHGWQGTLDESRKAALRDDRTVHVKNTAAVPQATAAPPPATTTAAPSAISPYPYAQTGAYRAPGYAYATPQPQRTGAQQPAVTPATYYPNAYLQGQTGTAQGQYQYFQQWYNYQAASGQKGGIASAYYGPYGTASKVVGNTARPQQPQQNGWGAGYGQATATTLPPNLRRVAPSTPGTPTPIAPAYSQYQANIAPQQAQQTG